MTATKLGRDGRAILLATLASGVLSCHGAPTPNPIQTAQPGDGGGLTFEGGIGADGGDQSVMITVNAPADGAILAATGTIDVQATIVIVAGGAASLAINPQSVRATLVAAGATDSTALTTQAPTPLVAVAAGDYRGKLSLTGLRTGDYGLRVDAATTAGTGASAQISVKVDAGPTITVLSPTAGGHYKGMLTIEATIDSGPYAPTTLPIDASVGGVPVAMQQVGTSTTFRGTLDFHQPNPPLVGDQLLIIAASNARGTRSENRTTFVVDETGPSITDTAPPPGQVVGGVIKIQATIADDAGVLPSSVIVLIGDDTDIKFKLPLAQESDGVYSVLFDTAKLTACGLGAPATGLCLIFPTLSFRAADRLGNETVVAYQIAIDNQPPLIDLDPPLIRDIKLDDGPRCSWLFDPLGVDTLLGDMPADGCAVSQTFDLRARVEDEGNPAGGLKKSPIAGLDPDTIAAYILDDTSQVLTVDTNGDGICDNINPTLIPTTSPPTMNNQVLKVRLAPLKRAGNADFTPDPSIIGSGLPCAPGKDPDGPPPLCSVNQPTIVISYAGGESAIWTVEPVTPGYCEGAEFDTYANHIGEGWACIAVAARDRIGNTGVSAPLRVFISYNQGGPYCPAPPPGASAPPDCTGAFNPATGAVTATPCSSRRFAPGELCFLGDCP
ncbi:MAG TPA: hypothetical protein VMU50_03435 [Polyangia bacterium]|nr:hypothetical protein [Polyangia bacterium]